MRGERELLLDTSHKVLMIDRSDETVERGLLLAVLKWGGGKMQLTGSDEFIKQAITIAADKKMRIEFADPEHNTMLKASKDKARLDYIAKMDKEIKERDEAVRAEQKAKIAARRAAKVDVKAPAPDQSAQPEPAAPTPAVLASEQAPVTATTEKEKEKDKTGTDSGGVSPAERPQEQPAEQHQVVYAPEPEQDDDLEQEQEIKPPGT